MQFEYGNLLAGRERTQQTGRQSPIAQAHHSFDLGATLPPFRFERTEIGEGRRVPALFRRWQARHAHLVEVDIATGHLVEGGPQHARQEFRFEYVGIRANEFDRGSEQNTLSGTHLHHRRITHDRDIAGPNEHRARYLGAITSRGQTAQPDILGGQHSAHNRIALAEDHRGTVEYPYTFVAAAVDAYCQHRY